MRTFFRWLWRFNALLIAAFGVLACVGVASYFLMFGDDDFGPWNPDERATITEASVNAPGVIRLVEGASTADTLVTVVMLGETRHPAIGAPSMEVARNFLIFDRATNQGRRVFENDEGQIGRYFTVDQSCQPLRQYQGAGFGVIAVGTVGSQAIPPPPQASAIVALWGAPGQSTWSLGVVDLQTGEWRAAISGIERLDDLMSSNGRCLAAVRKDNVAHAVDFGLGAEIGVRDQTLAMP